VDLTINENKRFATVKLKDLWVDADNMDSAYYRAQDSMGQATSVSTGKPLNVLKFKDNILILSDGHHRVADKLVLLDDTNEALNLEFKADIIKKNYNFHDSDDSEVSDWQPFTEWLFNTGDWTMQESIKHIRASVRKFIFEQWVTVNRKKSVASKHSNRRVEWGYHSIQGKIEGVNKNTVVLAIGSEKYCDLIMKKVHNPNSESYFYMVSPSKVEPGSFILKEEWQGFYD